MIALIDVPKLVRQKYWRDLAAFLFFMRCRYPVCPLSSGRPASQPDQGRDVPAEGCPPYFLPGGLISRRRRLAVANRRPPEYNIRSIARQIEDLPPQFRKRNSAVSIQTARRECYITDRKCLYLQAFASASAMREAGIPLRGVFVI